VVQKLGYAGRDLSYAIAFWDWEGNNAKGVYRQLHQRSHSHPMLWIRKDFSGSGFALISSPGPDLNPAY
jgi:hypothetical protein